MSQMYLLSQIKPEGQFAHFVFRPEDIDDLIIFISTNNSFRWCIETVEVYEPKTRLTAAERKARREELSKSSLPVPLSRS